MFLESDERAQLKTYCYILGKRQQWQYHRRNVVYVSYYSVPTRIIQIIWFGIEIEIKQCETLIFFINRTLKVNWKNHLTKINAVSWQHCLHFLATTQSTSSLRKSEGASRGCRMHSFWLFSYMSNMASKKKEKE